MRASAEDADQNRPCAHDACRDSSRRHLQSQHMTDDDDVYYYTGERLELEGETDNSTWHKTDDSGAPRTGGIGLDVLCALYEMTRREDDTKKQTAARTAVRAVASARVCAERLEARRQSLSLRAQWREVKEEDGLTSGAPGVECERLPQEQKKNTCR